MRTCDQISKQAQVHAKTHLVGNIPAVEQSDGGYTVADDTDTGGHVVPHSELLAPDQRLGDRCMVAME